MTSAAQDKHMEPQTDDNSTYIKSGDIQEVMQTVVTCNVSALLCTMFCRVSDCEVRGQVCWERAADRQLLQSDQKHLVCFVMLQLQPTVNVVDDYFSP